MSLFSWLIRIEILSFFEGCQFDFTFFSFYHSELTIISTFHQILLPIFKGPLLIYLFKHLLVLDFYAFPLFWSLAHAFTFKGRWFCTCIHESFFLSCSADLRSFLYLASKFRSNYLHLTAFVPTFLFKLSFLFFLYPFFPFLLLPFYCFVYTYPCLKYTEQVLFLNLQFPFYAYLLFPWFLLHVLLLVNLVSLHNAALAR